MCCFSPCRMIILLAYIGFFFCIQPDTVSSLRSMDLALRLPQAEFLFKRSSRILSTVGLEDMPVQQNLAPSPAMMFDPNQSDKRRVRRGSDPIHNRC
ncbi:OLC1v1012520C1 [Oldenlandia corymbosa var. corymbosa]|uniref:OLC1v1012520C1 n=1 Tax=Oldenlandia corymbosa var. corymbosa TaxID=529605 RepID=A0AAV1DYM0_OLDCO|nr:OLC1v1012520C1 [Oldenlandia corymbosa var. corymbosa]